MDKILDAFKGGYYDQLETRDPALREHEILAALPAQITHAKKNAPYFAKLLAAFDASSITTRAA